MREGPDRVCWPISKSNPGLHVILFIGLGGCCEKEVAPDAGCKENGSEEVNGEKEGRWDDKTVQYLSVCGAQSSLMDINLSVC